MKRFSSLIAILVTLTSLAFFSLPGTASAHTLQARSRTTTTHTTKMALHNRSSEAMHANYDADDPQDSGCWNNAKWANWGSLSVGGYTVQAINWYSYSCNTNWVEISWNSGTAVQTQVGINDNYSSQQCYPTDCHSYYTGGLSPSWTDMIDGTYTTYVNLELRANGQSSHEYNWIPA
jgi:hypothetical protein